MGRVYVYISRQLLLAMQLSHAVSFGRLTTIRIASWEAKLPAIAANQPTGFVNGRSGTDWVMVVRGLSSALGPLIWKME